MSEPKIEWRGPNNDYPTWVGQCGECGQREVKLEGNAAKGAIYNRNFALCGICRWSKCDRESLDAMESDTNLRGIADYIEDLRRKAGLI